MAWSDAARKAAAETRRRHAKTRGAAVSYNDRALGSYAGKKGYGAHAFEIQGRKGAKHMLYMRAAKYSEAKAKAMSLAKRVSARTKQYVKLTRMP